MWISIRIRNVKGVGERGCTVRAVSEMPRPYVEDVKQA